MVMYFFTVLFYLLYVMSALLYHLKVALLMLTPSGLEDDNKKLLVL